MFVNKIAESMNLDIILGPLRSFMLTCLSYGLVGLVVCSYVGPVSSNFFLVFGI